MLSSLVYGQPDLVSKTERLLLKGKYDNAYQSIKKSLSKDSINVSAYQAQAVYFTYSAFPDFNIDSSHYSNLTAIGHFSQTDEKSLSKLLRNNITLTYLNYFKRHIDSLAFEVALDSSSIIGYNYYLDTYRPSHLIDSVTSLRNQLAFSDALQENTYHSYRSFMEKYPKSSQLKEAKRRFEKLYFDESVKDGQLASYVKFLEDHPQSIYRTLAELQILELSTLANSLDSYLTFAEKFPSSYYSRIALNYAYHLNNVVPSVKIDFPNHHDSLSQVNTNNKQKLLPYYQNGFGFINSIGDVILPNIYQTDTLLSPDCPIVYTGFIWDRSNHQLITKSGDVFYTGVLDQVKDLGNGILTITLGQKFGVIHKSGNNLLPMKFQDVQLINNNYIAYQENGLWGITSMLGRKLIDPIYQTIAGIDEFILLQQNDQWAIINNAILANYLIDPLKLVFDIDDYEVYNDQHLIIYQGENVNLLSNDLQLRFDRSTLEIRDGNNIFITNDTEESHIIDSNTFEKVMSVISPILSNKSGVYYELDNHWIQWLNSSAVEISSDSIALVGDYFTKYYQGDSMYFSQNSEIKIHQDSTYQVLNHSNESYILINKSDQSLLLKSNGEFNTLDYYERLTPVGDSLLIAKKDGKSRLINTKGESILSLDYDAIQKNKSGTFTLLEDSKFGMFNTLKNALIAPAFDQILKSYNDSTYIAQLNGSYGLIDSDGSTISPFEFDQIEYWNDTSALVKQGYQWMIYGIPGNEPIIKGISQFTPVMGNENHKVMKIFKENGYGLIHSEKGIIIPATFYNIYKIENTDASIFIAEKYIEEADFYVVMYYNTEGEVIFKHAMESQYHQNVNCENP
jgi:sRNA-binding regulator protein Hfq